MKKLNAFGFVHHLLPVITVVAVAAVGTYVIVVSHAATPSASVTIFPANWQHLYHAVVTQDGTRGNVVLIRQPGKSQAGASGIFTLGKKTKAYLNGSPLPKLNNFVKDHFGKKAEACLTARGNNKQGASVYFAVNDMTDAASNGGFKDRNFNLGKTYSTHCIDFTLASKADYSKYQIPPDVWVENGEYSGPIYVDQVVVQIVK